MPPKLSYDDATREFESRGFKLLETTYVNTKTPMKCICPCGNETIKTLSNIKAGQKCRECGYRERDVGKTPYDIVVKSFKESGCKLLTGESEYTGMRQTLSYICVCGEAGYSAYKNFIKGTRCKKCTIEKNSGRNHPNFNPNLTDEYRNRHRLDRKLKRWKVDVKKRDNFTCKVCKDDKGGNLVSHHLYSYDRYENLRYEVDNGITLCEKCHMEFHNSYGYGNNTREQFDEFMHSRNTICSEVLLCEY